MSANSPWNRISVSRFRGLSEITLEELGLLNVLVGANDVGKTSLLEAILLLMGPGNITLPCRIQELRGHSVKERDDLFYLFNNCDSKSRIELLAERTDTPAASRKLSISIPNGGSQIEHIPNGAARIHSTTLAKEAHPDLHYDLELEGEELASPKKLHGTLSVRKDGATGNVSRPLLETNISAFFISDRSGLEVEPVGEVVINKKKEALLKYLQNLNCQVKDITPVLSRVYVDIGLSQLLPINMLGGGMNRTSSIIARCILRDSRVLLIDELSYGLHYEALAPFLRTILDFATENGIQIFATTHSLAVLECLREILNMKEMTNMRDRVVCYALQKDRHNQVQPYRYGYRGLDHCIEHGMEIR